MRNLFVAAVRQTYFFFIGGITFRNTRVNEANYNRGDANFSRRQ